jgi:hypothetical protein
VCVVGARAVWRPFPRCGCAAWVVSTWRMVEPSVVCRSDHEVVQGIKKQTRCLMVAAACSKKFPCLMSIVLLPTRDRDPQ